MRRDERSGAWHGVPSAMDRGTSGTAGPGRHRAGSSAVSEHLRSRGKGCGKGSAGFLAFGYQGRKQGADAVFEHLASDQRCLGMGAHLRQRVFTAAEADFEPQRAVGQFTGHRQSGQRHIQQTFLARAQLMAARSAIKAIGRWLYTSGRSPRRLSPGFARDSRPLRGPASMQVRASGE